MLTTTDTGYLYLGESPNTSPQNYKIAVPYPDTSPFTTTRMVDAARNSLGQMVGRLVGRSLDKQELHWQTMSCSLWWQLNRWFEAGHFSFYCHYFNHNLGRWETRRFYLGDVKCSPDLVNPATGEPAFYRDAGFSVIDCG